jgi:Ca2+-binding RTX toxin-like protein
MRVDRRGTLTIGATLGDDVVRVYRRSRDGRIVARVNEVAKSFKAKSIKRVIVYGYAGDDTITFGPGVRNGYIDGGAGDDSLAGGSRDDVLIGSSGADHIAGGDGRDASDDDVLDTRDSVERLLT